MAQRPALTCCWMALKKFGAVLFQPGEQGGGGVGKGEFEKFLLELQDGFKGSLGGCPGFINGPEPGQVEVSVA